MWCSCAMQDIQECKHKLQDQSHGNDCDGSTRLWWRRELSLGASARGECAQLQMPANKCIYTQTYCTDVPVLTYNDYSPHSHKYAYVYVTYMTDVIHKCIYIKDIKDRILTDQAISSFVGKSEQP